MDKGHMPIAALVGAAKAAPAEAEPDGEESGRLDAAARMRSAKSDREYADAAEDFLRIVTRKRN